MSVVLLAEKGSAGRLMSGSYAATGRTSALLRAQAPAVSADEGKGRQGESSKGSYSWSKVRIEIQIGFKK